MARHFDVPAERQANPNPICPAGLWPAVLKTVVEDIGPAPAEGEEGPLYAVIVTFSIIVSDESVFELSRVYPWTDEGRREFGNLCVDSGLPAGEIDIESIKGRKVLALTRTRGGGKSAFVKDTQPVPAEEQQDAS